MKKSLLIVVSLGVLLGLAACNVSLAGDVTPPPGSSISAVEETEEPAEIALPSGVDPSAGAEIYADNCQDCHGPQGLGDTEMGDALGVDIPAIGTLELAAQYSSQEWFVVVRDGRMTQMMPPFYGSLTDQEIWDVLGYVYALGTDREQLAAGEAIYGEYCTACHGQSGEGGAGAPSHQDPEWMTALSISEIVDKIATGNGDEDHVFANLLDGEQQQEAALYVRSLLFGTADVEIAAVETDVEETGEEVESAVSGEAESGLITGQVVNGSGGDIPEGLEATLLGYVDFELSIELTAPIEEDGSFRFEDIAIGEGDIFYVTVEHEDMFYPSDFYVAAEDDEGIAFEVMIYDATTDKSGLQVYRVHVFFEWLSTDLVQVVHLVTISNLGSETVYAPGETEPVLEFSLPADATDLVFESGTIGDPYVSTASGFGDPRPVAPGEASYEVLFAYEMEYDGSLTWTLPMDLPTEFVAVFVQGEGLTVESGQMIADADQQVEDAVYQTLVAISLAAGDEISIDISGKVKLESGGGSWFEGSSVFVIAAGVLGLAFAVYGVWNLFSRDSSEFDPLNYQHVMTHPDHVEALDAMDTETLLDIIVTLDEAFESGEIEVYDYHSLRDLYKSMLREQMDEE